MIALLVTETLFSNIQFKILGTTSQNMVKNFSIEDRLLLLEHGFTIQKKGVSLENESPDIARITYDDEKLAGFSMVVEFSEEDNGLGFEAAVCYTELTKFVADELIREEFSSVKEAIEFLFNWVPTKQKAEMNKKNWVVPEWLIPYIQYIDNGSIKRIEKIMNLLQSNKKDIHESDFQKHCEVSAQISLLETLHKKGLLK